MEGCKGEEDLEDGGHVATRRGVGWGERELGKGREDTPVSEVGETGEPRTEYGFEIFPVFAF